MTENRKALTELRSLGAVGQAREISHYLYFEEPANARRVAGVLAAKGFEVECRLGADGVNWLVLARKTATVNEEVVADHRSVMEDLASEHSGEYDGWEVAAS